MASFNAVIVPAKALKGGKHKIRIAVSHNGETRYIVTDIVIDSAREFRNGVITKRDNAAFLNTKLRGLLQNYQEILEQITYIDGLTCAELVSMLKTTKNIKNCTLGYVFEEYISSSMAKQSSIKTYKTAWNTITKHINKDMLVSHVTHGTLMGLEKFLRGRKLRNSTISNYMLLLSSIIMYAKKCGYVFFKIDPFWNYHRPSPEIREAWLTVEEIKKLRDYPFKKKNFEKCRDLFMLSYYLGGINITDLIDIDFSEQKELIHYIRKKTESKPKLNGSVEFEIPEEAREIIGRLVGKDGRIQLKEKQRGNRLNGIFKYNMPRMAKIIGVQRLIYYSARKSFSQHAFELGIDTSVIDYILGHSIGKAGKSLYHYVYVSPSMATDAIRKVLDNLK